MTEAEQSSSLPTGSALATIVESNPSIVLINPKAKEGLFNHIKDEISNFTPDVSTARGRDAIKSFAFKITKTKTAIDAAGKLLTEDARKTIDAVNAARRESRDELQQMADQVRKPLTDWEEAEKKRVADCEAIIARIKSARNVYIEDTSEIVRERGKEIFALQIDPAVFKDATEEAQREKDETIASLRASMARLKKAEDDAAELARLKQAEADRIQREEQKQREAEDLRRKEQEEAAAEAQRKADEEAEARRVEEASRRAAEEAREAEARKAREEQEERERKHQADLAAERERVAKLEQEKEDRERVEREQREAEEARQRDFQHREAVKSAAAEALVKAGAPVNLAEKIVLAIIAGEIPNVKMEF